MTTNFLLAVSHVAQGCGSLDPCCVKYMIFQTKKWPCQMWILLFHPLSLISCFTFHISCKTKYKEQVIKPKQLKVVIKIGSSGLFRGRTNVRLCFQSVCIIHGVPCILPVALMHDDKLSVVLSLSLSRALKERYDCISRSIRLHTNRPSMMLSFFYLLSIHHFVLIALSFDSTTSH